MTIARWLKRPGDAVTPGEPLLVAVNDAVEVAFPATQGGVLERVLIAEGATAQAGAPIAVFAPAPSPAEPPSAPAEPPHEAADEPPLRCSPVARRIAAAGTLDPGILRGSGPGGRVMKADVLAALAGGEARPQEQPARVAYIDTPPASHALVVPAASDAHVVLTAIEVDLQGVAAARERLLDGWRHGAAPADSLFVALSALDALTRHPLLNSTWTDDWLVVHRRVHLALVGRAGGRVLICDAQDLNARGLARAVARARAGAIVDEPTETGTFTVADSGERLWWAAPALGPHQTAALSIGARRPRPVVVAERGIDRVAVRPITLLALAYDARVLDQCRADAFLRDVKTRLENFDR
jgi:pyruvate/2-oxoglutarate dehydrogenase complex dihydrolipoamide acyltransferase (E2) component